MPGARRGAGSWIEAKRLQVPHLPQGAPASPALSNLAAIASEEGFEVNHRKTRPMHRGHRQRLTGIVVNEKPNAGRVAYVASLNSSRGAKLEAIYRRIGWT
jgi:hypothetical protein